MTTIEEFIKARCTPHVFEEGSGVDYENFCLAKGKKDRYIVFNEAYLKRKLSRKANGGSYLSGVFVIWIVQMQDNTPDEKSSTQIPRLVGANEVALSIWDKLERDSDLSDVDIEPVLTSTAVQMSGVKLTGYISVKQKRPC